MRRRRRSLEEQRDAWTGYPRRVAYVNIGATTTIPPIDEFSYTVTMLTGDTLTWTAQRRSHERQIQEHLKSYPDIVPVESERALAWIAAQERERAQRAAERRERDRLAEAWLAERNVPDYVIEHLRNPVFGSSEEIP